MRYFNLNAFLKDGTAALAKGPVALIFAEDLTEVDTTLRHHLGLGFSAVILFAPDELVLSDGLDELVHRVNYDCTSTKSVQLVINTLIERAPKVWFYYCFNAEYLFYPFCETRSIGEMLAYHTEERRFSMISFVIDLYAGDLDDFPQAVSLEDALLDKSGYYALARKDGNGKPRDRQLDFFGGLRWRFEEHIAPTKRRIDRISMFRAKPGLKINADLTFNDQEYNTYSCPWHHNLTSAIVSFRTAKALKTNAGSTFDIKTFRWHNSVPFEWHSRQLLDLGLIEPGQWF